MEVNEGCDLIAYAAETLVRDRWEECLVPDIKSQDFLARYITARLKFLGTAIPDFAERVGVSRTFMYRIQSGEKDVSEDLLVRMAQQDEFCLHELMVARTLGKMGVES